MTYLPTYLLRSLLSLPTTTPSDTTHFRETKSTPNPEYADWQVRSSRMVGQSIMPYFHGTRTEIGRHPSPSFHGHVYPSIWKPSSASPRWMCHPRKWRVFRANQCQDIRSLRWRRRTNSIRWDIKYYPGTTRFYMSLGTFGTKKKEAAKKKKIAYFLFAKVVPSTIYLGNFESSHLPSTGHNGLCSEPSWWGKSPMLQSLLVYKM